METKKNLGGRPTKYKEEYNEQARKLCLLGYTDDQLADFFQVDVSTINNWKIDYPMFFESLKRGKDIADTEIVESLYNRAKGGIKIIKEKMTEGGIVELKEEIAPDPASMMFWLKNRQPKHWRDKQELDVTTKEIIVDVPEVMPDDEN